MADDDDISTFFLPEGLTDDLISPAPKDRARRVSGVGGGFESSLFAFPLAPQQDHASAQAPGQWTASTTAAMHPGMAAEGPGHGAVSESRAGHGAPVSITTPHTSLPAVPLSAISAAVSTPQAAAVPQHYLAASVPFGTVPVSAQLATPSSELSATAPVFDPSRRVAPPAVPRPPMPPASFSVAPSLDQATPGPRPAQQQRSFLSSVSAQLGFGSSLSWPEPSTDVLPQAAGSFGLPPGAFGDSGILPAVAVPSAPQTLPSRVQPPDGLPDGISLGLQGAAHDAAAPAAQNGSALVLGHQDLQRPQPAAQQQAAQPPQPRKKKARSQQGQQQGQQGQQQKAAPADATKERVRREREEAQRARRQEERARKERARLEEQARRERAKRLEEEEEEERRRREREELEREELERRRREQERREMREREAARRKAQEELEARKREERERRQEREREERERQERERQEWQEREREARERVVEASGRRAAPAAVASQPQLQSPPAQEGTAGAPAAVPESAQQAAAHAERRPRKHAQRSSRSPSVSSERSSGTRSSRSRGSKSGKRVVFGEAVVVATEAAPADTAPAEPRRGAGAPGAAEDDQSATGSAGRGKGKRRAARAARSASGDAAAPARPVADAPHGADELETQLRSVQAKAEAGAAAPRAELLGLPHKLASPVLAAWLSLSSWALTALAVVLSMLSVAGVAVLALFWRVHRYALRAVAEDHNVAACFSFLYAFPHLVAYVSPWTPPWAPICLWYAFLVQIFCTSGPPAVVIPSRIVLPLLFLLEGVSHHSFLLDLNGAELLVIACALAAFKTQRWCNPLTLLSLSAQAISAAFWGESLIVQWIILVGGLSTLTLVDQCSKHDLAAARAAVHDAHAQGLGAVGGLGRRFDALYGAEITPPVRGVYGDETRHALSTGYVANDESL